MTDSSLNSKEKFTPRDYQVPIIEAIINHCKQKDCEPAFVDISVGGGKTSIYAFVADHVANKGGKVMVLARQGELVEQNSNFAWKAHVNNSIYSASLQRKSTAFPVVYGTEGTVARAIGEDQQLGWYTDNDGKIKYRWVPDLLMIDESHQVDYDNKDCQYMKIINYFLTANPRLRIIGGTGSPIRGKQYIVGEFWKKRLYELSTEQLVEWGWLVPPIFGFPEDDEHSYDFSSIEVDKDGNTFSDKELDEIVLENPTKTHEIIHEIMDRTQDRLGVLIFCSTKKHCKEAAQALPEGSYGIISDSTGYKERNRIYKASRAGEIKYLINVGVLATGYNNPRIDTVCYLRPLDSLTLLIQTLGRGFRIPEDDDNFEKSNCLVLDYADVFARLGDLYENPILEKAVKEGAKRKGQIIFCPKCNTENSMQARRCIGKDENTKERCEYFWSFRACPNCETKNDPCARECRQCKFQLIDPNEKLSRQHYTEKDLIPVLKMQMIPCRNDGVLIKYYLENGDEAKEFFSPFSGNKIAKRIWRATFIKEHVLPEHHAEFNRLGDTKTICQSKLVRQPIMITHRINDKGNSVINRRIFK